MIVIFSEDKERKQQQTREKKINKKQYNVESDVFYDAVQPEHTQKTTENKQTNSSNSSKKKTINN